jgi:TrmH family RNA methyltransferase
MERITSLNNPKIKNIVKLQKASERRKQNLFLIEGYKEISFALENKYELHSLFYCPELSIKTISDPLFKYDELQNIIFEITPEIYAKIAYRDSSDGLLGVAWQKKLSLDEIKLGKNPLIIILEGVEKPGNLGAILRTADAIHADAVIITDLQTDIFNPNVIRSSVGCFFTTHLVSCSNNEAHKWLNKNKIISYAAVIHPKSQQYHLLDYTGATAFIMGTEANGLTEFWIKNSNKMIAIPMLGQNDSLNVSTATAVLVYEAKRQRKFK